MAPGVSVESAPPVLTIRIARPERENRLNREVLERTSAALARADASDDVGAVVITGTGATFSCGGDVAEFAAGGTASYERFGKLFAELHLRIANLSKPVLAAVNGDARAGGMSLLSICDLAVAVDSACFSMPEIRAGLWPIMAMVALNRALPRKRAFELYYFGGEFDATEARALGLINWIVREEDFEAEVARRALDLARLPRAAVRIGRSTFAGLADLSLEEGYTWSARRLVELLGDPEVVAALAGRREKA